MLQKNVLSLTPRQLGYAFLATAGLLLSGCGQNSSVNLAAAAPSASSAIKISGILHGGPNPIQNANIILWQTTSSGYPSATNDTTGTTSLQLATATTDSTGSFSFTAGSYTCASGQFAYITATGGFTGSNAANNQEVQVAAIGSCSHLDNATDEANTRIFMSEVTTVAAAYALGNFMYVNDNGGTGNQLVYISAPANNNAATGSCTSGSPGSSMTCTAAGLAHAFANAANLVDAVHFDGTTPTGLALSVPGSNPTYGTVPAAELNTLGNILQSCTNSAGGTTTGVCGTLFSYATPYSSTNGVGTTGGVKPVNELQAILNIAKSPDHNVGSLFNQASPNSFFQPSLSAAPHDWSIAITYAPAATSATFTSAVSITGYSIASNVATFTNSGTNHLVAGQQVYLYGFPTSTFLNGIAYTVSATGLSATQFEASPAQAAYTLPTMGATTESGSASLDNPYFLTLDANDNVYVLNQDGATATEGGLSALSANGTPLWSNALSTGFCQPFTVATDTNGGVWWSSDQASTGCASSGDFLQDVNATNGSTIATYTGSSTVKGETQTSGLAFDRKNNLWLARHNTSCNSSACIYYYVCTVSGSSCTYANPLSQATLETGANAGDINSSGYVTIDSNQNIYFTSAPGKGTTTDEYITVYQNTGTASTPAWTDATANFLSVALPYGGNGTVAIDGSGNVWGSSTSGTSPNYDLSQIAITYGGTNGLAATLGSPTNFTITASSPNQGYFDGVGTYWFPNGTSSGGIFYYVPTSTASLYLQPCFLPTASATACSAFIPSATSRVTQVDSTGSIWAASELGGQVVQIIGSAAPTWPQLSYAKFGTEPQ